MIDNATFNNLTVSFHTLGCKLNFAETSSIGNTLFAERGIKPARKGETPDISIINTCSVTELADKKCRQTIRKIIKNSPESLIIVTGCYAQLKGEEISHIDGVNIILGSDQKGEIVNYIDDWFKTHQQTIAVTPMKDISKFNPSCSRGDRTRYFLKVQDGCDYFCSYCTVPYARGRSRSGKIANLVEQAKGVAAEGGKEIVLTGVNIGDFGKGSDETFFDLIKALDTVEGIERFRISSIEPNLLTDEIIDWVATEAKRFMPHFHIPLQSGSDAVLKLMRRRYDTALFATKVEHIRRVLPDAYIGVDLIVGSRGETDELFEESYNFCKSLDISSLHVFTYSERAGTAALQIEHSVNPQTKNKRTHRMIALSDKKLYDFTQRFISSTRPVLFEQPKEGFPMHGFTDNYLRVEVDYNPAEINNISEVTLDSIMSDNSVNATLVK
ncbi:MAG: tRNA (N(6)-L-threonylcarbamoyladenosine(37)-C(2))-methylthiotransferase MtaB [Bacteroidales bacterium]